MKKQALMAGIIVILLLLGVVFLKKGSPAYAPAEEPKEQKDFSAINNKDLAMEMRMTSPEPDSMMQSISHTDQEAFMLMNFLYQGSLADVTEGKSIRGTATGRAASGMVKATYADGVYSLYASADNLPDPTGSDFYEGWIVRKNPFEVISTGKLEKIDSQYKNFYTSTKDLTDHDFFVITLEQNDNNPAPADHILEGTLKK